MAITNLNQYYQSKGQSLPTVGARQGVATQAGISGYTGTTPQNDSLLKFLSSNPSATSQNPSLGSPAAQTYMQGLNQSNSPSPANPTIPSAPVETPKDTAQSTYLKYLTGAFNPEKTASAFTDLTNAKTKLADIQSEEEAKNLSGRRDYERLLDAPGGTVSGARESAALSSRRTNSELADLSVRESAAARSANVASDVYNAYISAGKSAAEAEAAANKATADKTQQDFENKYKNDSLSLQRDSQNKPISVSEGNTVFDPVTGKAIFTAPAKVDPNAALDNKYKQAQIANIYSQIEERNKSDGINSDPSQTIAYAQQYASTGMIPVGLPKGTLGTVAQYAKELPKDDGTIVDRNTGIKSPKVSSTQMDGMSALLDLTHKLDEAKDKFSKLDTGILAGTAKTLVYTKAQQQYDDLKGEIVDLLARARSGAALTKEEVDTYSKKLPGRFNDALFLGGKGLTSIEDLKSSIEGKLKTNLSSNNLSVFGYSKVIGPDGKQYTVGQILSGADGKQGRVNPDGTITIIQQ